MSKLYNNIIRDISESIKYHLNEMARKAVNRTIDKKLWLTVSSIISRNRSTEAEDVKPIGNDKDNLLQRYVAALLIMKKPCPNDIEDIGNMKTFKKIGYKFIDLGGTIQDILKLYNENSGNSINKSSNTSNNKASEVTKPESETISDDDDDFWSNFGKNVDNGSDDDSFLSDIENDIQDQYNDNISKSMEALTTRLTKYSDLESVYFKVVPGYKKPVKFTLIKPDNINDYQYYKYSYNSNIGKNHGYKLWYDLIEGQKWTEFKNPVFDAMFSYTTLDGLTHNIGLFYLHYYVSRTRSYTLPVNINEKCHGLYDIENEVYKMYKIKDSRYINTYKKVTLAYNDIDKLINNTAASKLFKSSSFIQRVLISPDNGLMLYVRYIIKDIIHVPNDVNIDNLDKFCRYARTKSVFKFANATYYAVDLIGVCYDIDYILTFTGENMYNDILLDSDNSKNNEVNKKKYRIIQKQFKIFKDMVHDYAYNFAQFFNRQQYTYPNFTKLLNTYGISLPVKDYNYFKQLSNTYTIIDCIWGKHDPNKTNIWPSIPKNKRTYTYTTRDIDHRDPRAIASIKSTNNMFILKLFKTGASGIPTLQLELLPEGLQMFKEICVKKKIPLNNDVYE